MVICKQSRIGWKNMVLLVIRCLRSTIQMTNTHRNRTIFARAHSHYFSSRDKRFPNREISKEPMYWFKQCFFPRNYRTWFWDWNVRSSHIYIHLNAYEMRDHRNDERYWAKQLRKESVKKYPGLNSCVSFRSCVHNRDALSFIILQWIQELSTCQKIKSITHSKPTQNGLLLVHLIIIWC